MGGGEKVTYDSTYYLKSALAGGICCSATHGALCPVDVVKTRMQLDPVTYNRGLIGGMRQVVQMEGVSALATGLGATAGGYWVQGMFKFGGVELIKINLANSMTVEQAWERRTGIYIAAAAGAEFVADIFLCPFEAARIGAVQNPKLGGLFSAAGHIYKRSGFINGFYAGFGPILFKQVPYTIAKFLVQGRSEEMLAKSMGIRLGHPETSRATSLGLSLSSGVIAGVVAAIISHPADTLLSLVNKPGNGGDGSIASRLVNIAKQEGPYKLCFQGLQARCFMVGTLTALQFGIFDSVMAIIGAKKFHFSDPNKQH